MEQIKLLTDPQIFPTKEVLETCLRKQSNDAFIEFTDGLKQFGITLMDWRYYTDTKCWLSKGEYKWTTSRGSNKVKPIFWLSIWQGFFKLSFYFGSSMKQELLNLPLSLETKYLVQSANPEGKPMKFMAVILDVNDSSKLDDAYILAKFKKEL